MSIGSSSKKSSSKKAEKKKSPLSEPSTSSPPGPSSSSSSPSLHPAPQTHDPAPGPSSDPADATPPPSAPSPSQQRKHTRHSSNRQIPLFISVSAGPPKDSPRKRHKESGRTPSSAHLSHHRPSSSSRLRSQTTITAPVEILLQEEKRRKHKKEKRRKEREGKARSEEEEEEEGVAAKEGRRGGRKEKDVDVDVVDADDDDDDDDGVGIADGKQKRQLKKQLKKDRQWRDGFGHQGKAGCASCLPSSPSALSSIESIVQVCVGKMLDESRAQHAATQEKLGAVLQGQKALEGQLAERDALLQDVVKSQAELAALLSLYAGKQQGADGPVGMVEILLAAKISSMTEESNRMKQRLKETSELIGSLQEQIAKLS